MGSGVLNALQQWKCQVLPEMGAHVDWQQQEA